MARNTSSITSSPCGTGNDDSTSSISTFTGSVFIHSLTVQRTCGACMWRRAGASRGVEANRGLRRDSSSSPPALRLRPALAEGEGEEPDDSGPLDQLPDVRPMASPRLHHCIEDAEKDHAGKHSADGLECLRPRVSLPGWL